MKFEFNHKTGTMQPKKDEGIYFAKSQGGGLIVDDKKHNIKFIIERNERITKLFGSFDKDNLNIYDMMDARIIADRVVRLFGSEHKYSDFHYFLKGYVMKECVVKSYSDFIGESIWQDIQKRSSGEVRKEDGRIIGTLDDGTKLILPNDAFADGNLVHFEDGDFYTINENPDCPIYIAVIEVDEYMDIYYIYDETSDDIVNMVECFEAYNDLRMNNFCSLRALIKNESLDECDLVGMHVDISTYCDLYTNKHWEYKVYSDYRHAKDDAISDEEDLLQGNLDKNNFKRLYNLFGDSFLNVDGIEECMKESYKSYYCDLDEDEKIKELINYDVITDDGDYFDIDEDGNTDHTQPHFESSNYENEYADAVVDGIVDVVGEFVSNFGFDSLSDYINYSKLAECIVEEDGVGDTLARYDGVERIEDIEHTKYYIYKTN